MRRQKSRSPSHRCLVSSRRGEALTSASARKVWDRPAALQTRRGALRLPSHRVALPVPGRPGLCGALRVLQRPHQVSGVNFTKVAVFGTLSPQHRTVRSPGVDNLTCFLDESQLNDRAGSKWRGERGAKLVRSDAGEALCESSTPSTLVARLVANSKQPSRPLTGDAAGLSWPAARRGRGAVLDRTGISVGHPQAWPPNQPRQPHTLPFLPEVPSAPAASGCGAHGVVG